MSSPREAFNTEEEYLKELYSAPDDELQHILLDDLGNQQHAAIPDDPTKYICPQLIMQPSPALPSVQHDSPQETQERNL